MNVSSSCTGASTTSWGSTRRFLAKTPFPALHVAIRRSSSSSSSSSPRRSSLPSSTRILSSSTSSSRNKWLAAVEANARKEVSRQQQSCSQHNESRDDELCLSSSLETERCVFDPLSIAGGGGEDETSEDDSVASSSSTQSSSCSSRSSSTSGEEVFKLSIRRHECLDLYHQQQQQQPVGEDCTMPDDDDDDNVTMLFQLEYEEEEGGEEEESSSLSSTMLQSSSICHRHHSNMSHSHLIQLWETSLRRGHGLEIRPPPPIQVASESGMDKLKKKQVRFAVVDDDPMIHGRSTIDSEKEADLPTVQTIVHLIPRNDAIHSEEDEEDDDLVADEIDPIQRYWTTPQEYNDCRHEATKLVGFYRKYEFDFQQCIKILTLHEPRSSQQQQQQHDEQDEAQEEVGDKRDDDNKQSSFTTATICTSSSCTASCTVSSSSASAVVDHHAAVQQAMDEMSCMHGAIRGLESQVCTSLSAPRKQRVAAVLQVQEEMVQYFSRKQEPQQQRDIDSSGAGSIGGYRNPIIADHDEHDYWLERIRQASMSVSLPNRNYAHHMGLYDHMEGLKASLSRWRKQTTKQQRRQSCGFAGAKASAHATATVATPASSSSVSLAATLSSLELECPPSS